MKRLLAIIALLGGSALALAQVQLGKGVQVGTTAGSGATLPTNAVVYGTSSTTSRPGTSSDIGNLLQSAPSCTTPGYVYSPQSNSCVPAGSGTLSGQTAGCAPKAASGTTSTSSLPVCDDGTTTTITHPLSISTGTGQGGTFNATEGTAATAAAGHDILYADSVSHCLKYSANGASFNCLGSGALSGQTLNFVPLATSSVASTISSHFFEASNISGVQNPFQTSASAPNCVLAGPTFTKWGCNNINTSDDGSSFGLTGASAYLAATVFNHNAWGGHAGFNGVEGRTSQVFGDGYNSGLATAGIKQDFVLNESGFGIGDFAGFQIDHLCYTGIAYASDEGCKHFLRIGEVVNTWQGDITGGTNTAPTFTSAGGCGALENQACAAIAGGWMLDTTVVRGTGNATGISAGPVSWTSSIATNFAPPAAGAWGYALTVNLTSNTSWELPVSQTFTLQSGAGTFAVGDHACVIGSNFTEQNIISAVSGTSPTQTITIPLAMPETSVLIAQGDCMAITPDADNAQSVVYAIPAVSLDGSHLIASLESYSQNLPLTWPAGTHWSQFDGGATSGIHLYATSRITMVATTNSAPGQAWVPENQLVYLMPNSYFSVGDHLISAHYESQLVTGLDVTALQDMAGSPVGISVTLSGHGMAADSSAYKGVNGESTTSYTPFGGPLFEPTFILQAGVFDNVLNSNYTPLSNGFYFNNHQPGQTAYNIWRDPTWGIFSIATDGFHFDHDITGNSFIGMGIVSGAVGLKTGIGDGAGNSAGVQYPFPGSGGTASTWLTQCNLNPFTLVSTDLCLTSQGNSRSTFVVTADRGLQVGSLVANGDVTIGGSGGLNHTINFGTNYGNFDLTMYDGGAAHRYGWGLTAGTMNFVVPSTANSGGNFMFNNGGDLGSGTNFLWINDGIGEIAAANRGYCWANVTNIANPSPTPSSADTCMWRDSAGTIHFGNGTANDNTAVLSALELDSFNLFPNHITTTTANSDLAGTLTLSGGVATYTFITTWTHSPVCTASDVTAVAAVQVSATTGVLTIHGTGTDQVNYICIARL